ncbi:MAG: biotin/lipoyl-containing protein [Anaerovoracaceae bacterium]
MKVDNVLELIKEVSKLDIESFEYEEDGSKISVNFGSKNQGTKPVAVSETKEPEAVIESIEVIKSPLVGTFYVAPSEGGKPFVKLGDEVKVGDVVGIVEAMKLMNEIPSKVEGTIGKILVENGQMVEFGQPLFEIV